MNSIELRHCQLPIECPAICDNLKEVPEVGSVGFISLCSAEDGVCPFAKVVEHFIKSDYPTDPLDI